MAKMKPKIRYFLHLLLSRQRKEVIIANRQSLISLHRKPALFLNGYLIK